MPLFLCIFLDRSRDKHHSGVFYLFNAVSSCETYADEGVPIVLELLIKPPPRGLLHSVHPFASLSGLGLLKKFDFGSDGGTLRFVEVMGHELGICVPWPSLGMWSPV
jgi:hypothetical protein